MAIFPWGLIGSYLRGWDQNCDSFRKFGCSTSKFLMLSGTEEVVSMESSRMETVAYLKSWNVISETPMLLQFYDIDSLNRSRHVLYVNIPSLSPDVLSRRINPRLILRDGIWGEEANGMI